MVWFDHLDGIQIKKENIKGLAAQTRSRFVILKNDEGTETEHIVVSTDRGDLLLNIGDWISYDRFGRLRLMRMHDIGVTDVREITSKDDDTNIKKGDR